MKVWAGKSLDLVPPKSKIGMALRYFLAECEYLAGYLKDGRIEMDNGYAERAVKYFAIGRKNWLFCDSTDGANASALFYSLLVTAKINGANPYQALKRIFDEVPLAHTADDYERLAEILLGITIVGTNTAQIDPEKVDEISAELGQEIPPFNIGTSTDQYLDVLEKLLDKYGR